MWRLTALWNLMALHCTAASGAYQGSCEQGLTENGIWQVFGASKLLKVICVRSVFVSESTSDEGAEGLHAVAEHTITAVCGCGCLWWFKHERDASMNALQREYFEVQCSAIKNLFIMEFLRWISNEFWQWIWRSSGDGRALYAFSGHQGNKLSFTAIWSSFLVKTATMKTISHRIGECWRLTGVATLLPLSDTQECDSCFNHHSLSHSVIPADRHKMCWPLHWLYPSYPN